MPPKIDNETAKGRKQSCGGCHLNTLGSLGYSVLTLGVTAFVLTSEIQRLLKVVWMAWPPGSASPQWEVVVYIGLVGGCGLLVPFFFCASIFKTGNLANDGFRLGVHDGSCSRDESPLPTPKKNILGRLWRHGCPTAPFVHLVISHLLLLSKTMIEGVMIKDQLWPQDLVWSSELSFLLPQPPPQNDRLEVILSSKLSMDGDSTEESRRTTVAHSLNWPDLDRGLNETLSSWGQEIDGQSKSSSVVHTTEMPLLSPLSPHLVNYLLAHVVFAGKYAGVFWGTNKAMSFVLLLQLLLNAVQSVLFFNGFQVLFKTQMISLQRDVFPSANQQLLLSPWTSFLVYNLAQSLILFSGCVVYLYAYCKFEAFLSAEKEKYHILSKVGHKAMWPHLPQCSSLVILVAMTTAVSPLVYEWTTVYRASLDTACLFAACGAVLHLFLWIIIWFALLIKSRWSFKLRVQVSKTVVGNSHSIRLVNEVQLSHQVESSEGPVMIIGSGKTYVIQEGPTKRALMSLVRTALADKKARGEEEEIYWLRPKSASNWEQTGKLQGPQIGSFTQGPLGAAALLSSQGVAGVKNNISFKGSRRESFIDEFAAIENRKQPTSSSPCFESPQSTRSNSTVRCDVTQNSSSNASTSEVETNRQHSFLGPNCDQNDHPIGGAFNSTSVCNDFPAPPPELINPAYYPPPPPDTPPPPLPNDEAFVPKVLACKEKVRNPVLNAVRCDSSYEAAMNQRDVDCCDNSSTNSSVTPTDRKSDSGVHSQASSSDSHYKCDSSSTLGNQICGQQMAQNHNSQNIHPDSTFTNDINGQRTFYNGNVPIAVNSNESQRNSPWVTHYEQSQYHNLRTKDDKEEINPKFSSPISKNVVNSREKSSNLYNSGNSNDDDDETSSRRRNPLNIEIVGGGGGCGGFLPPSKYVASEPVYSDSSTPVAIRRRNSITAAMEPETPPYQRSANSFSTFTETPSFRSAQQSSSNLYGDGLPPYLSSKAMTVGGHLHKLRRPPIADSKHATIASTPLPRGFHHPSQADSRYFSISSAKPPGTNYPSFSK